MSLSAPAKSAFDLKSTAWTLTALRLHTADLATLAAALDQRFGDSPGLFDNDPLVIDLGPLREADEVVDIAGLLPHLRRHHLLPIAAQGGSPAQMAAARDAGLAEALDAAPEAAVTAAPPGQPRAVEVREVQVVHEVVRDVVHEVVREVEVLREVPGPAVPTLVIDKPLRSGQRVYARGGDLVVLAVVSFGAEVIADGNIHVYAPLRGRAIAGARGNTAARIFSTCLEAQLVAIAGIYRTTETPLPADVLGQPAQVWLDGEKIIVEALKA
jgi:septum site-determining protein MinC